MPKIIPKARVIYGAVQPDGSVRVLHKVRVNGDKTYVLTSMASAPDAYDLARLLNAPLSERVALGVEALKDYDRVHSSGQPSHILHGQVGAILRALGLDGSHRA